MHLVRIAIQRMDKVVNKTTDFNVNYQLDICAQQLIILT